MVNGVHTINEECKYMAFIHIPSLYKDQTILNFRRLYALEKVLDDPRQVYFSKAPANGGR